MRKWLLIFLLLLNVIVFFGFAMQGQKKTDGGDVEVEQAFELRLVSEVAPESLVKKVDQNDKEVIQARVVDVDCVFYEGIESQQQADEIAGFMAEQGLEPVILMGDLIDTKSHSESESSFASESSSGPLFERYSIQLKDTFGRNLINKINDVLKIRYKSLKIGKKVCKGVASVKPDQ